MNLESTPWRSWVQARAPSIRGLHPQNFTTATTTRSQNSGNGCRAPRKGTLLPYAINRLQWRMGTCRHGTLALEQVSTTSPRHPFRKFESVIARLLPGDLIAARNTYIYACNVDEPEIPAVFDDQRLASFRIAPGAKVAESMSDAQLTIPSSRAVALSSCLPFVEPLSLGDSAYADGGIYSNLPANMCGSQGALGGNCVILVLATPFSAMRPDVSHVDYRTTVLLDFLRERQRTIHPHASGATTAAAIARSPIYCIEPDAPLKSGLARGMFCQNVMDRDIAAGRITAARFVDCVRRHLEGDMRAPRAYEIGAAAIPATPASMPTMREFWTPWVNRRWIGQGVGAGNTLTRRFRSIRAKQTIMTTGRPSR